MCLIIIKIPYKCSFKVEGILLDNNYHYYVIMTTLYGSDIFKIYKNFEPSKLKMWEIARSYNPIEFAKLLYLLENVSTTSKRSVISLSDEYINYNPPPNNDDDSKEDIILKITNEPKIRLDRGVYHEGDCDIFWNDGSKHGNMPNYQDAIVHNNGDYDFDFGIDKLLTYIRSNNIIYSDNVMNIDDNADKCGECIDMALMPKNVSDIKFKVLNHNIGTLYYNKLLKHVEYLLFNDNFQNDRNEMNNHNEHGSIVLRFMQFYKTMNFKQSIDNDARNFRNIVIPKPVRIFDRNLMSSQDHIVQPLYQGFHVIVYSSPSETKCYSRFGTLHANLAYSIRCQVPCTFEAVILPIDRFNNVRCWRYWPFRTGFVMYVVDVFRYEQTILTSTPFKDRIKYIDLIVKNQPDIIYSSLAASPSRKPYTWTLIEQKYINNRDLYDPIVGVVLREPNHTLVVNRESPLPSSSSPQSSCVDTQNRQPKAFYFNILYSFDILNSKVIDLKPTYSLETIRMLHLNHEMADYKTICVAYGHCDSFIYLCVYNRDLHQFVHAATLQRSPHIEYTKLVYKPEKIYVINNKVIPRGILYLRVYYDISKNIIGYENKHTDDRFKIPYKNQLLSN